MLWPRQREEWTSKKWLENNPEAIHKIWADPSLGLRDYDCASLSDSLGLSGSSSEQMIEMLNSLYAMFIEKDCSMIEINPLVKTKDGSMVALDAKVGLDENANFRHPWRDEGDLSEEEDVELEYK